MRSLRFLHQRPVVLFAVAVCAFAVWIGREALDGDPPPPAASPETAGRTPTVRFIPPPVTVEEAKPAPLTQILPKLKPGMKRTEVEAIVGAPDPADIRPATVTDGRVTYHTAYDADLGPPATVRPVTQATRIPAPLPVREGPRRLVTLEYDATQPGHPLVGIHYPAPTS